MNAKFEKWADGEKYTVEKVKWTERQTYYRTSTENASKGWQAAIQSLDVTPELCRIAEAAYDAEPATPLCDSPAMKEALRAFLSALKEQAK